MGLDGWKLGAGCALVALALGACDGGSDPDGGVRPDATTSPMDGGRDAAAADAATDGRVPTDAADPPRDAGPGLALPPANGGFDYQLGEAYTPPSGVVVVGRDRNAPVQPGIYNICYVNGFQTQPDERDFWLTDHPDLLLRDSGGAPVIDPDWDEIILDVTTDAKRAALLTIVGGWIDGCADAGFDAIEIDNLDTYSRSGGLVSQEDAVIFMRSLAARAHARGMPIAQKNSAEILPRHRDMGTDFAVVEECNRYSECGDFVAEYGDQVYVIEYRRADFDAGCRDFPNLSVVLRDLALRAPGTGYVYDGC